MVSKLLAALAVAGVASAASGTNVAKFNAYWGQTGPSDERLRDRCDEGADYISLSFVTSSPENNPTGYPGIGFAAHCWGDAFEKDGVPSNLLNHCQTIIDDLEYCRKKGTKMLLSIGGVWNKETSDYRLTTEKNGRIFANFLWRAFGPYDASWTGPRPFDKSPTEHSQIDGFDFDLELPDVNGKHFDNKPWIAMADQFRRNDKNIIITGAPQCPTDPKWFSMQEMIQKTQFDALFIQFYNNVGCDLIPGNDPFNSHDDFNYNEWEKVIASSEKSKNAKLFVGVPAAPDPNNSQDAYVNPQVLEHIICKIAKRPSFGGISIWDMWTGKNNIVNGKSFNTHVQEILTKCGLHTTTTTTTTTTSTIPSTTSTTTTTTTSSSSSSSTTTTTSSSTSTPTSTSSSTSSQTTSSQPTSSSSSTSSVNTSSSSETTSSTTVPTSSSSSSSSSAVTTSSETSSSSSAVTTSSETSSSSSAVTTSSETTSSTSVPTSSSSSSSAVPTSSETSSSSSAVTTSSSSETTSSSTAVPTSSETSSSSSSTSSVNTSSSSETTSSSTAVPTSSETTSSSTAVPTSSETSSSSSSSSSSAVTTSSETSSSSAVPTSSETTSSSSSAVPTSTETTSSSAVPTSTETTSSSSSVVPTSSSSSSSVTTAPTTTSAPVTSAPWGNTTTTTSDEMTTSTVFTTTTYTITSCAPTVTNCPVGHVTTETVYVSTTVCPVTKTTEAPQPTGNPGQPGEEMTTSTVYATKTFTITKCAPTVTNCPVGHVVTQTVSVSETVCPVTKTNEVPQPSKPAGDKPSGNQPSGNKPTQSMTTTTLHSTTTKIIIKTLSETGPKETPVVTPSKPAGNQCPGGPNCPAPSGGSKCPGGPNCPVGTGAPSAPIVKPTTPVVTGGASSVAAGLVALVAAQIFLL